MNTGRSITVNGTPYQYEADAAAGISLDNGKRWWGTQLRWRAGVAGHWKRGVLVDVHPFDFHTIEAALERLVERDADRRADTCR